MATPVPAVERASRILGLLAEKPDLPRSLTDIAGTLQIHKGTCHSILAALAASGFVVRDDRTRTWGLGSGAVELGLAAVGRIGAAGAAVREMHRLHETLGASVLVAALLGEELVVIAGVGDAAVAQIGTRQCLVPPMGLVFKAWDDPAETEAWLAGLGAPQSAAYARQALDSARRRGFVLGLEHAGEEEVHSQIRRILRCGDPEQRVDLALELADLLRSNGYSPTDTSWPEDRRVRFMSAPVLRGGPVELAITLFDIPGEVPVVQLERWAQELLGATRRAASPDPLSAPSFAREDTT
ncbi:helix-turn-helix domain-containing protein [Pseudonocardia sp. NPDC049154]|uniref:IclR family transcriptional regulator n=1 Tax=Pseudonocardia sp. NPDC049154 TaxID=3155501 RepID=UPI0033D5DF39